MICPICGEYHYGRETCEPAWSVWLTDETSDEARKVHAPTAHSAAERWAAKKDFQSAEYRIANGHEVQVFVRKLDGEHAECFTVYGEAVPEYTARTITPEPMTDVEFRRRSWFWMQDVYHGEMDEDCI